MSESRFIEPLDVLFLRGNHAFGDPGDVGPSVMPPLPTVAAGAVRSWLLVEQGIDPGAFARGEIEHPWLGTPRAPGPFSVRRFTLGRRTANGRTEAIFPLPADLIALVDESGGAGTPRLHRLHPQRVATGRGESGPGVRCSSSLPALAVLPEPRRAKPATGFYLDAAGYRMALAGELPEPGRLIAADRLWSTELRTGVGLSSTRRSAEQGRLFTAQAIVPARDSVSGTVGFCVAIDGCDGALPEGGTLRFGGDGRGAVLGPANIDWPEFDPAAIAAAGRCRLVLDSPGLFPGGWRLPGDDGTGRWRLGGVAGRVTCASVGRHRVISGFDLAHGRPKPAERAAPTGSVYWIEALEADAEALSALLDRGLWPEDGVDSSRRAEGFNRFSFGIY